MFRGEVPGFETLGVVARAENVSVTWLMQGIGAPYAVHWFATDESCRAYFGELLQFQDWTVHRLTDGGRVEVLVLHAPATIKTPEKPPLAYTEIYVLAGCGRATVALLARLSGHRITFADTETVAAVASGEKAGTWWLLGDEGLLRNYQTVKKSELKVAEPADSGYGGAADAISAEERMLVELYRQLAPEHRVRLKEVGHAFAAEERLRREDEADR
jgi:hypothetical protein